MKSIFFDQKIGFSVEETERPSLLPDEVRLKVLACGICGSDRQVVKGESLPLGARFPFVMGHEIAGVVIEWGEALAGEWQAGDRVAVHPFIACGSCSACLHHQPQLCIRQKIVGYHLPGGFSEEVVLPAPQLVKVPENLTPIEAAVMTDAYATPFHALKHSGVGKGSQLLVIGTGGLGLASMQLARALQVDLLGHVTRREKSFALESNIEADALFSLKEGQRSVSRQIRRAGGPRGFDCVLDTIGTEETLQLALESVRPGGTVTIIGMTEEIGSLSLSKHVRRGIRIHFSYGSTKEDLEELMALTNDRQLKPQRLIAGTLPLEKIEVAFSDVRKSGRWVILPDSKD